MVGRETGATVGRYVLGERIGAGGMGVVYDALQPGGGHVAVKLLCGAELRNPEAVRRLHDEAVAGQIVHHGNVVSYLEHGVTSDGYHYVVMERVPGVRLGELADHGGVLSLRDAARIVQQVLLGLQAMHELGIIHGDVKSDNVLVERRADGSLIPKLIDLGLARVRFDDGEKGAADVISGTPDYMAPEVIRGEGGSPASDIYAVGVILYELLTGTTPFGGGTSDEIFRRHLDDDAVPPSLRAPEAEIPPIFERIVMHALAKVPERRFASASAFAAALAVAIPSLDEGTGRAVPHLSSESPTLDWSEGPTVAKRRRVARGTPGVRKP